MTSDFRRHWQVALATLLIWCSAGLLGSIVKAADDNPVQASEAESQAIADRLDTLVEQATAQVGKPGVQGGEPGTDVHALRQQLDAAEAQIALLKNVVIQALRAQSAAEEALRREQATPRAAPGPESVPAFRRCRRRGGLGCCPRGRGRDAAGVGHGRQVRALERGRTARGRLERSRGACRRAHQSR